MNLFSLIRSQATATEPTNRSEARPDGGSLVDSGPEDEVAPMQRSSTSRAETLADALCGVDEMVFVLDDVGQFTAASSSFLSMLGIDEAILPGLTAEAVFFEGLSTAAGEPRTPVRFRGVDDACYVADLSLSTVTLNPGMVFKVGVLSALKVDSTMPATRVANHAACPPAFNAAMRNRLKSKPAPIRLTAGRIELIGLEEVKAALGPKWPSAAERAKAVAVSVLKKRLDDNDMFTETTGDAFLVCFGGLDCAAARIKSELISREIRDRLVGTKNDVFNIVAQTETVEIAEAVSGEVDVLGTIIKQLDEARAAQRRAVAAQISEYLSAACLQLTPVMTRNLQSTGLMDARIGGGHLPWLSDHEPTDEDLKLIFDLDAVLLGLVTKHIYQAQCSGRAPAIIVPVSYSTLNERKFLHPFMTLCRSIDESVRNRIIFEVYGLTPNVGQLRLQELLSCLAPFSAHRILRARNVKHQFVDLNRFRLSLISIQADRAHTRGTGAGRSFEAFAAMVHRSGTFVAMTSNSGCRLLVRGIAGEDSAEWYLARGADFVCLVSNEWRGANAESDFMQTSR
ncbi:MAG: hypothetical protein IPK66_07085 [Rhodospirillales bacterium]|nr:hypothetical protein [Rhodospirillales bacterium]